MQPIDLLDKVRRRDFTLGVMGLGRVGLPLALAFASRGIRTISVASRPPKTSARTIVLLGGMATQDR